MIRDERYKAIMNLLTMSYTGTIKVNDIMEKLSVSDMTVRRDLATMEVQGLLKRVHGGAKINTFNEELSHKEKQIINIAEKKAIAQKAVELINEDEAIFLGPGTTIELVAKAINKKNLLLVTNCLPVFKILNTKREQNQIYLIGGELRNSTQAFVGEIPNKILMTMKFHKTFFSCNALKEQAIMTATLEEGQTQAIALDNSQERFLLVDASKIGKTGFCVYYDLNKMTKIITNKDTQRHYEQIKNEHVLLVETDL
ncbi:DeoR/GlpR family DNA-binding transcription regulator [Melissococcus plutonius]|uniref:DeoR/GlpR family DNA-binding transcription regulator n=1 Tax=Melissococcus plutonius TaxID=33970 RepID=UPI00065E1EE5|nr:DeoR/GlpR family DNA-binding transcription regulator [Melissococcus plutonius]KMT41169.1 lactose phosphotransferase system repressor [Melissococcus plutonius]